ncbi:MAG: beta-galactosidase GalB, partial [Chitinophagaceae bacterium]|nr:beta-galactosidase GalB [Chitinophagaceae bacterium]
MKRKACLFFAVAALFVMISAKTYSQTVSRVIKNFNTGWKFYSGDATGAEQTGFNDQSWRSLNLPHDWSIEGEFSDKHPAGAGGGALPGGIGWYRKSFTIPVSAKDNAVFIDFDGVYRNSEVWINGHYLGKRPNGYISFRYDLTPYLKTGSLKNVIAVKVDNSQQPNSRWYSGSGIYRNVWLTITGKVYIEYNGTFITTPKISGQSATVNIKTTISNHTESLQQFMLSSVIYSADGKKVAALGSGNNIKAGSSIVAGQDINIPSPALWSVDKPYLYRAVSAVVVNGKEVDRYETAFGIRSFHFDVNNGFFLNGEYVKIRGVCNHHDLGCLGAAINTRALERQLEILKAMGCNAIRTSHNPPAPELLNLCDRMGFIIMDETFDMWARKKNDFDYHLDWQQWHKRDLEDHVLRDRNHPSVMIWSVGNEIGEQWGASDDSAGIVISKELVNIVKSLDTTRPVVTANNETGAGNKLLLSGAYDITGYNYHHDEWKDVLNRWRDKPFIITESVSALQTRGHYDMPSDSIRRWPKRWDLPLTDGNADFTCSAYDNCSAPWGSTHEETLKVFEKYKHISGMFIWTGFDYLGEPTPYNWPAKSSYFGIIDLAGFPKDVYYLYQSVWTNKPVLHLFPHWNWKGEKTGDINADTVDVWAYYNNADEVQLFLNGKPLGARKKKEDDMHVGWKVKYEPGVLKAISKKDGSVVLTREIKTAGKPSKIILNADRNIISASGTDLSFITVKVADENGTLVPYADDLVKFKVSGGGFLAGVDNGNPASHESFKAKEHKVFNGLCVAVIQSSGKKENITVTAASKGLEP